MSLDLHVGPGGSRAGPEVRNVSDGSAPVAVSYPNRKYASLSAAQKLLVVAFLATGAWYLSWRPTAFNWYAPLLSSMVFGAEAFGFACALLYLVMCWRLKERSALPVPDGVTVAVFVPTI